MKRNDVIRSLREATQRPIASLHCMKEIKVTEFDCPLTAFLRVKEEDKQAFSELAKERSERYGEGTRQRAFYSVLAAEYSGDRKVSLLRAFLKKFACSGIPRHSLASLCGEANAAHFVEKSKVSSSAKAVVEAMRRDVSERDVKDAIGDLDDMFDERHAPLWTALWKRVGREGDAWTAWFSILTGDDDFVRALFCTWCFTLYSKELSGASAPKDAEAKLLEYARKKEIVLKK